MSEQQHLVVRMVRNPRLPAFMGWARGAVNGKSRFVAGICPEGRVMRYGHWVAPLSGGSYPVSLGHQRAKRMLAMAKPTASCRQTLTLSAAGSPGYLPTDGRLTRTTLKDVKHISRSRARFFKRWSTARSCLIPSSETSVLRRRLGGAGTAQPDCLPGSAIWEICRQAAVAIALDLRLSLGELFDHRIIAPFAQHQVPRRILIFG